MRERATVAREDTKGLSYPQLVAATIRALRTTRAYIPCACCRLRSAKLPNRAGTAFVCLDCKNKPPAASVESARMRLNAAMARS